LTLSAEEVRQSAKENTQATETLGCHFLVLLGLFFIDVVVVDFDVIAVSGFHCWWEGRPRVWLEIKEGTLICDRNTALDPKEDAFGWGNTPSILPLPHTLPQLRVKG
jgi:hypothetical protein